MSLIPKEKKQLPFTLYRSNQKSLGLVNETKNLVEGCLGYVCIEFASKA